MHRQEIQLLHEEKEGLPPWMVDVLCDLQRAADQRGLRRFSRDIRQLRTLYPTAPCDCDMPTGGAPLLC